MSEAGDELDALLQLMRRLRAPEGCAWDREQTFATIAPYTIEEAYEVADAIERRDMDRLRDELGDLLFQVVFHARMAEDTNQFDFAAVARGISAKLIRRHPHLFAEGQDPDGGQLPVSWEALKAQERAAAGDHGVLADVPRALPALSRAAKLGRRAARVGFDWDAASGVRAKIDEELTEVDAAIAAGRGQQIEEEIGDLLFAIANWARHLGVDPEHALRGAGLKFERRFEHMEQQAAARKLTLATLGAGDWERLWLDAKSLQNKPE